MASIQERLQLKRISLDEWSLKEKLCLASAVKCSGDQNWMSVSRSLKAILGNSNRPKDWFLSKNCAIQYGKLLDNVETPKRKKRTASERDSTTPVETPVESLVRKLTQERVEELRRIIPEEQTQLIKMKEEIKFLENANLDEAKIRELWAQVENDKKQKERDQIAHQQWLKEREEKKAEMERIWRPGLYINVNANKSPSTPPVIKKEEPEVDEPKTPQQGTSASSATSPLLTSLLKSSSPAPINSQSSTIIQTTNVRSTPANTNLLTAGNHSMSSSAVQNPPQYPSNDHHSNIPASQQAPTLSMLLDKKPLATATNSTPLTDNNTASTSQIKIEEVPQEIENNDDPNKDLDDQQLIADLDDFMPDELENILNTNLLEEEEILENVASLIDDDIIKIEMKDEPHQQDMEMNVEIEAPPNSEPQIEEKPENVADVAVEASKDEMEIEVLESEVPNEAENKPSVKETDTVEIIEEVPVAQNAPEEQIEMIDSTDDNSNNTNEVAEQQQEETVIILEEKEDSNPEFTSKPEQVETITELTDGELEEVSNQETIEIKEDKKEEIVKIEIIDSEDSNNSDEKQEVFEEKSNESTTVEIKDEADVKMAEDEEQFVVEENSKDVEEKEEKSNDVPAKSEKPEETQKPKEEKAESDEEMFMDAKENLDESGEKQTPTKVENPVITAIKEEETTTKSTTDSDDDALIEVVKAKRDYTRKKQEAEAAKKSEVKEESESTPRNLNLRTSRNRDRSESPMVDDDNSDTPLRTRRRYSSTLTDSSSVPNSPASTTDDKEYKAWKKSILIAFNRIYTHKNASLFQKPIQEDQYPNYKNLVYRPMDLTTVKKNLENGIIRTTEHFTRDILLIFTNMMIYSKRNSSSYKLAQEMLNESLKIIESTMDNTKVSGTLSSASSTSSRDNEKSFKRGNRKSLRVL